MKIHYAELFVRWAVRLFGIPRVARVFQRYVYFKAADLGLSTFNLGYAPLSEGIAGHSASREPYQLELYRQVALAVGEPNLGGAKLLEISCGLGGGLKYLSGAFNVAFAVGLDRAFAAAQIARGKFGLTTVQADATRLPFASGLFDAAINVEALHMYFDDAFFAEAARVLRPGGRLVIADFRESSLAETRAMLEAAFARNSLSLVSFHDITANVAAACLADSPRREALLRRLPLVLRPIAAQIAGTAKSRRYEALRSRREIFFIATVEKGSTRATP